LSDAATIRRQGIPSTLFMYLGLVIGFVNNLLFPRYVGEEVLGFTLWLMEITSFIVLFAGFGGSISIVRFFPYFKDKAKGHNGYLALLFILRTAGFIITAAVIFLLKDWIVNVYDRPGSRVYIETYFPLLLLTIGMMLYTDLLENYLSVHLRTRVPTFLRDVFLRVVALMLIVSYTFGWINLEVFIITYVCRFIAGIVAMLFYTYYIDELHWHFKWRLFKEPIFRKMLNFSYYSILASLGNKLTTKIDVLMIPALLSMGAAGIYGIFMFFTSVITIAHNSIAKITSPMIAAAWKRQDISAIQQLYTRTAINNLAVGVLVFVGILINLDNIVHIVGPQFAAGKGVALFLGIGQLIHTANGYNGIILNHSPLYRYDLLFRVITAFVNIVANYILIQWYGITGAAIATALTVLLINCLTQGFVYYHYQIYSFSINMLYMLLLGIFCLGINELIPVIETHYIFDLLIRSTIITLIFVLVIIKWRIAPDIADFILRLIKRLK
jgi:O-antigen/teichoic acid export membrane protein